MLTENDVTQLLVNFLKEKGYKILKQLTSVQKGIDVEAKAADGMLHYIEVKGETSNVKTSERYNLPFKPTQIWSHVSVALLKTVRDINRHDPQQVSFGMAFPRNHEDLLKVIKPSLDKLDIKVYLVGEDGVTIL